MEIFNFVEQSFDFGLINKCKNQLNTKSIKKINSYLRELIKSEVNSSHFKITINNDKFSKKINNPFEENINNKQILENDEKEDTTSAAENSDEYLSY